MQVPGRFQNKSKNQPLEGSKSLSQTWRFGDDGFGEDHSWPVLVDPTCGKRVNVLLRCLLIHCAPQLWHHPWRVFGCSGFQHSKGRRQDILGGFHEVSW